MSILAVESSCDETAVAIYHPQMGLQSHLIHSQVPIHQLYGGVVPELASRDHIKRTLPLIQQAIKEANITPDMLTAIAYTKGPGLVGALMVGASVSTGLSRAWDLPLIGVHHMEAHVMAVMLEDNTPSYPFLALIVSGGHTMLVDVEAFGRYKILGETLDDAVGEAFDKTASILGLPYPGGPELSKLAKKGRPGHMVFPRPMTNRPGLDFSFSGLKTHALNCVAKHPNDEQTRADIACAFEEAVVSTMLIKVRRAIEVTGYRRLVVAGGVSANTRLRSVFDTELAKMSVSVYFPRHEFCTDNAAMIAYVGSKRLEQGVQNATNIDVRAQWPMTEIE